MESAQADLVEIVRDFVSVHQQLGQLFTRFREGSLEFEEARDLVADSDSSLLFRFKERVHHLFRSEDLSSPGRRGGVLFDLAVGSLFHEALKFRENFYQLEVYGPKVRSLRLEANDDGDELLREFEKILSAASERLQESLTESETLLEQMRNVLTSLLADRAGGPGIGLVARYVIENRADVEAVYPEGLVALLTQIHGDVAAGYMRATHSYLGSGRFGQAVVLITEALPMLRDCGADGASLELRHLREYARGMQAFLDGDYGPCVEALTMWIDSAPPEKDYGDLALVVLRRLPQLIHTDGPVPAAAAKLIERLESRSDRPDP